MRQVPISPDQEVILLKLYDRVGPAGDFSVEEKLELALDTLINSYDATLDAEEEQQLEGETIDAARLKEVVQSTLNPHIGTDFKQPEGDATPEKEGFTFFELLKMQPDNETLKAAEAGDDIAKAACELVFNQIPKDMWKSSRALELVTQATALGRKQALESEKNG